MGYSVKELELSSSDGKNTVRGAIYLPEFGSPRAVIAISHGMIDYVGRYVRLVEYFTERGYAVAGNDHLGHGKTAACPEDFGYFAKKDGYKLVIDDLKRMNEIIRSELPGVPVVLLGHSMGSFLARLYAEKYPDTVDGLIIHGTGGKNPLLPLGKTVIALVRLLRGDRHRSRLVNTLAFGSYNDRFDKLEGEWAWLTRETALVCDRDKDPYTAFKFTAAGYADLFKIIGLSNGAAHFDNFPKNLPTLVISGEADPVGDYGKGVKFVYDSLLDRGCKASLKLYEGARHELFNETNRDEVFSDILAWIEREIPQK